MNDIDDILSLISRRTINTYQQFRIQMDIRGMNVTKELFKHLVDNSHYIEIYDFLNNSFSDNCEFLDLIKIYPDVFDKFIDKFGIHLIYINDNCNDLLIKYGYMMDLHLFLNNIWRIRPGMLLNYYINHADYFIKDGTSNLNHDKYENFLSIKCDKLKGNENFKPYYDKFIETRQNIHRMISLIK